MSITRRGLIVLAVVAASAAVLPDSLATSLFALALVVVATDAWAARAVPKVTLSVPPILSRGVPSSLAAVATPGQARLRLAPGPDLVIEPLEATGRLVGEVVARRRGSHTIPRPATRLDGPLGLGRWYHRAGDDTRVVVYPDMVQARRIATEVRLGRFGESTRRSRGPLGLGTELESIREYLPDDDIRQVNWRATARTGVAMSNTYRVEQERELMILVDSGRLMAAPVGDDRDRTRLDAAVDAAAAVATVADVMGDRTGVLAFDSSVRRRASPRRAGGESVVRAIHDLEPSAAESDYEMAFRLVAHSKRAFVLILTDLLEETAARPLIEAMPILARHHAVVVAGVTDPSVIAALSRPAASTSEAFLTAAVVDAESSRRRAAARIGGYGATVIDCSPDQLARRCVDAYLRAKRLARL